MIPPPSPPVSYSTASTSYSGPAEGKKFMRRKDFQYKYGQRHHSYDSEKAPYPLCYDRHVLELEALDNRLAEYLQGSSSFTPFEVPPRRVLDLGCGTGTWIINAAKEWRDCDFVGFDLVDVQIPLKLLDSSVADRIEWRHGNFLTTKLPFEDDEFDHVHIQSIATGVPESKWGVLFEEITRVLRPGGSIEIIEDDTLFPSLPRWFTTALRARPLRHRSQSTRFPGTSRTIRPPPIIPPDSPDIPSHDHALLESLYKSVFENRFIHMKPSEAILPGYFTTYFRQVTLGPVLSFPMPPLAPLQPLPPQITTSYIVEPSSDPLESRPVTMVVPSTFSVNRPISTSFSSSISTLASASSIAPNGTVSHTNSRPRTASAPLSYHPENSMSSFELSFSNDVPTVDDVTTPLHRFMIDNSMTESESVALPTESIFPKERLESLSDRSLGMHLYRSYQTVLACQEAMWEELKDRIRNRKVELLPFGWDDDEELEELVSRKKFERLIERYKTDMQVRISMWCSLDTLGWPFPTREPLSKAELIEEERMRESMIEARKQATFEELQIPCRSIRVLVGYNL